MLTGKGFCLAEEESINSPFWYLQYGGSEHGPFGFDEVVKLLGSKRLKGTVHFWRPGLVTWVELHIDVQDQNHPSVLIQNAIANYERFRRRKENATAYAISLGREPRKHARHGFVASVFSVSESGRRDYIGVCIDLSERGLGVSLHPDVSCDKGALVSLEIVPISVSGLRSFRTKGTVCWSAEGQIGVELMHYAGAERTIAEFQAKQEVELGRRQTSVSRG
jgi:hypothetical protein